ncbi:XRE family transcriptional regulator [Xylanibacillus composti]|nr:XRE family transcriptional regulator [Xylanibacillus composti]
MLRMLMAERDINTTELSDKSGVSVTTISNLRNGRIRQPKKSTLEAVARALGVDSEVLESH